MYKLREDATTITVVFNNKPTTVAKHGLSPEQLTELQSLPQAPGWENPNFTRNRNEPVGGFPQPSLQQTRQMSVKTPPTPQELVAQEEAKVAEGEPEPDAVSGMPPVAPLGGRTAGVLSKLGRREPRPEAEPLQPLDLSKLDQQIADKEKALTELDEDIEGKRVARKQHLKNLHDSVRALEIEIREEKVVPFKELGMGQRIGNVLAAAAFAAAAARSGSSNPGAAGMAVINQAVERSVGLQRQALEQKRGVLASQHSRLGALREQFRSEDAADLATRNAAYQQIRDAIDFRMKTEKNQNERQRLSLLKEQLDNQIDGNERAWMALELQAAESLDNLEARARLEAAKGGTQKPLPINLSREVADIVGAVDMLEKLKKDHTDKTGPFSFMAQHTPIYETDAKVYNNLRHQAVSRYLKIYGSNPSDRDVARAEKLIPKATDSDSLGASKLNNAIDLAKQRLRAQLEAAMLSGYNVLPLIERYQSYLMMSTDTIEGEEIIE